MLDDNIGLHAARAAIVDILHRRSFLLSMPLAHLRERRHASDQRKAERVKYLERVSPEDALYIGGAPHDLETALKSGRVRCWFQHKGQWWVWKDVPDKMWKAVQNGARLIGADGTSRVDSKQWVLRVSEEDWCKCLGKPSASAPSADVPPAATIEARHRDCAAPLADATDEQIREAMRTVYGEKGDERPNYKKIVSPVRARLEAEGLYAKWDSVIRIAREKEFEGRRNKQGPARASRKSK